MDQCWVGRGLGGGGPISVQLRSSAVCSATKRAAGWVFPGVGVPSGAQLVPSAHARARHKRKRCALHGLSIGKMVENSGLLIAAYLCLYYWCVH